MSDAAGAPEVRPERSRTAREVSVIVPVRDAASTLPRQLALLAGERSPVPWEVIVVDNGSSDRSVEVAGAHAPRFDRLTTISATSRRGPAHARNAGARAATGDLLCFCDADDEIEPGWIAALIDAAARHDFVAGRLDVDTINSARARGSRPRPIPALDTAPPFAPSGNMAIWASVFERSGGFDEELRANEDVDLSDRLLASGATLGWAPDAVVHYRLRDSLRALAAQSYRSAWGAARVRHRRGQPVIGSVRALATRAAWLLTRLPTVLVADRRGRWVHAAGTLAGTLAAAAWLPVAARRRPPAPGAGLGPTTTTTTTTTRSTEDRP